MTCYVIRLAQDIPEQGIPVGAYLASYDPDFVPEPPDPPYPGGLATWTMEHSDAMMFDSLASAHTAWSARSKTVPLRPDGEPNRPLSALTVEIMMLW